MLNSTCAIFYDQQPLYVYSLLFSWTSHLISSHGQSITRPQCVFEFKQCISLYTRILPWLGTTIIIIIIIILRINTLTIHSFWLNVCACRTARRAAAPPAPHNVTDKILYRRLCVIILPVAFPRLNKFPNRNINKSVIIIYVQIISNNSQLTTSYPSRSCPRDEKHIYF